ncbi:MAG: zinc dependent phospholipase C family protein, partial [Faecousia sp.]
TGGDHLPSMYAHARFSQQAAKALPEHLRLTVQRFGRLYDVGAYGPDFFFFYQPLFKTKMGALGSQYHKMTGKEFFEAAARHLQQAPSEGGRAYLFGVLCHYALDSVCHPLICQVSAEGSVGHTELETEFDRHLLTQDGKVPAHRQNLGRNMHLTWGECVTVSGFYPPATAYTVRQGVGTMSLTCRALTMKNRKLLESLFRLGGEYASQMVMYPRPNHRCAQLIEPLEQLYARALERYPTLAAQLAGHLENGTPLGPEFDAAFG